VEIIPNTQCVQAVFLAVAGLLLTIRNLVGDSRVKEPVPRSKSVVNERARSCCFSLDELSGVRVASFGFGLMPNHPTSRGVAVQRSKACPYLIRGSKFKVEEQSA
jgi:hypothetical protein